MQRNYLLFSFPNNDYTVSKHMQRLLAPLLLLSGLGLLAFMFFVKADITWEEPDVMWVMALLFHMPFILFLVAAVTIEIRTAMERRQRRRSA